MADRSHSSVSPDDIDRAKGPSKGDENFGGHDAEAQGAAKSEVGQPTENGSPKPRQAPTDRSEFGEKPVRPGR